jgi:hypothetical protein
MDKFFKSFGSYYKDAQFDDFSFWAFPICTLIFIWLLTTLGVKIFSKRKKLKTVFVINRAWIISSLIAAGILIGLICFWWSRNFFAQHPYQLALLISLTIAMLIPVISLFNLRSYYTPEGIKEITDQPKTAHQLNSVIVLAKKAFTANKFYFFIPLLGFLLLFLYFYKGTNLITLVYDNSASMQGTNAIDALSETFSNLEPNNEIILTTLEGYLESDYNNQVDKKTIKDIQLVSKYSTLKGGNVVAFSNPTDARNGLSQISNDCNGSPICEALWKTFLFIQETKPNQTFDKKLLIVITDGADNIDNSLALGKFLFDDEKFSEFYPSENTFVIDYSNGTSTAFLQRCTSAGCEVYPAENSKQAYLDALDNALQSFKNNWFLIFWTAIIFALFTIIALLIQPKKIV